MSSTLLRVKQRHPLQPEWGRGSYLERFADVAPYLSGRSVLDVGAGSGVGRDDWIHAQVATVASSVVGVELDARLAARACALGFDVRQADAERMRLGEKFEVIWAGELIEHLSCPGAFLDRAREHLVDDGHLVLTTPNAFAVSNFVYRVGGQPRVNAGHTCWYDETTLTQLLVRHGFEVLRVSYLPHRTPGRLRAAAAGVVRSFLPERLARNTLLVVARPSG